MHLLAARAQEATEGTMRFDKVRHASGLAARAQEATEGTDATLLFDKVRQAIADFRAENPAMQALASAAVRHLK